MVKDPHTCELGPVCPEEHVMGENGAGQVVIVHEECSHPSCQRIRDRAAGCDECCLLAIAEDRLIDDIEDAFNEEGK